MGKPAGSETSPTPLLLNRSVVLESLRMFLWVASVHVCLPFEEGCDPFRRFPRRMWNCWEIHTSLQQGMRGVSLAFEVSWRNKWRMWDGLGHSLGLPTSSYHEAGPGMDGKVAHSGPTRRRCAWLAPHGPFGGKLQHVFDIEADQELKGITPELYKTMLNKH